MDEDVLKNQRAYCRYASEDHSKPADSWRPHSSLTNSALHRASTQSAAAQQATSEVFSPFQAFADSSTLSEPLHSQTHASAPCLGSTAWHHTLSPEPRLMSSLEEGTDLQHPQLLPPGTNVNNIIHHHNSALADSRSARAPVSPFSQDPYLQMLNSAPSFASDTFSVQTCSSLALPDMHPPSAEPHCDVGLSDDCAGMLSKVRIELTSAPAMFGQPLGINKPIAPAFQVAHLLLAGYASSVDASDVVYTNICACMHIITVSCVVKICLQIAMEYTN